MSFNISSRYKLHWAVVRNEINHSEIILDNISSGTVTLQAIRVWSAIRTRNIFHIILKLFPVISGHFKKQMHR